MDANLHYNYDLLKLGSIIERIHKAKFPDLIRRTSRPAPLSKLRDQLDKQYVITEQAVILSCSQSSLCREMFFVRKGGIPRIETIYLHSVVCWLGFSGSTHASIGMVSRMAGGVLEEDEILGSIKMREEIGWNLDAGTLVLELDEAIHLSPRFKYMFSVGVKCFEIGVHSSELKEYLENRGQKVQRPTPKPSPQRPLRRLSPNKWRNRLDWKPGESGLN